jgi:hypothetical protein
MVGHLFPCAAFATHCSFKCPEKLIPIERGTWDDFLDGIRQCVAHLAAEMIYDFFRLNLCHKMDTQSLRLRKQTAVIMAARKIYIRLND